MVLKKKKLPPFFIKLPFLTKEDWNVGFERTRNSDETKIQLLAKYGKLHFLTEKYPEAQILHKRKPREETIE